MESYRRADVARGVVGNVESRAFQVRPPRGRFSFSVFWHFWTCADFFSFFLTQVSQEYGANQVCHQRAEARIRRRDEDSCGEIGTGSEGGEGKQRRRYPSGARGAKGLTASVGGHSSCRRRSFTTFDHLDL